MADIPIIIPDDSDRGLASNICVVFEEILNQKILKKNKKYGNSVYEPIGVFSKAKNPIELICIRVDDKLKRLVKLERDDPKYLSEIKEIIAYLLILIDLMETNYE